MATKEAETTKEAATKTTTKAAATEAKKERKPTEPFEAESVASLDEEIRDEVAGFLKSGLTAVMGETTYEKEGMPKYQLIIYSRGKASRLKTYSLDKDKKLFKA